MSYRQQHLGARSFQRKKGHLNESVLREVPKVDDILAQLAGAKVFSKIIGCQ